MSLYLIVGAMLLFGTIYEVACKKPSKYFYLIAFAVLLLMLCFRYGQGTDYFAYQYLFDIAPQSLDFDAINNSYDGHTELGWKFICSLFKVLNLDYYVFVAVIGFVTMLFLNRFIQKHCVYKVTALFIAYPTLYLTYIFSGMRQGLVMCVFLGVLLDWYIQKKHVKFVIGILVCTLFHSASIALVFVLIPFIMKLIRKYEVILIVLLFLIGFALGLFNVSFGFGHRSFNFTLNEISYIALFERIITFFIINNCMLQFKNHGGSLPENIEKIYYLYVLGLASYGLLFASPVTASRICIMFKVLEIALLVFFMSRPAASLPDLPVIIGYVILITLVMLIKNIDSYIVQGDYYDSINVFNYPYHNVFTKELSRRNLHYDLLQ